MQHAALLSGPELGAGTADTGGGKRSILKGVIWRTKPCAARWLYSWASNAAPKTLPWAGPVNVCGAVPCHHEQGCFCFSKNTAPQKLWSQSSGVECDLFFGVVVLWLAVVLSERQSMKPLCWAAPQRAGQGWMDGWMDGRTEGWMCDLQRELVGSQWQQQISNKRVVQHYVCVERFCVMMPQ